MKSKKETRGRKAKPAAEKKSAIITIKFTEANLSMIREFAADEKLTMTDYLTRRGLKIG